MSDKIQSWAYGEWREQAADEYAEVQRRAFVAGFEAAVAEVDEFELLYDWAKFKRIEAEEDYARTEKKVSLGQQLAFRQVLGQLSKMGYTHDRGGDDE